MAVCSLYIRRGANTGHGSMTQYYHLETTTPTAHTVTVLTSPVMGPLQVVQQVHCSKNSLVSRPLGLGSWSAFAQNLGGTLVQRAISKFQWPQRPPILFSHFSDIAATFLKLFDISAQFLGLASLPHIRDQVGACSSRACRMPAAGRSLLHWGPAMPAAGRSLLHSCTVG